MRGLDLKALDMMQAVQLLWFQSFFSVGFAMLLHVYLVDGSGAGNTPNYNSLHFLNPYVYPNFLSHFGAALIYLKCF